MPPPLLRSDAQANRARLVEAARAVFAERGVQAEMKEIADRAGLGMGTIYRNFATKDDLIAAIILEVASSVMVELSAAAALADPVEAMRAMLRVVFATGKQEGPLFKALMAGGYSHAEHASKVGPPAAIDELFESVVQRARAAGALRPDLEPSFVATYLISMLPLYIQLQEMHAPGDIERQLTDLFFHAVLIQG